MRHFLSRLAIFTLGLATPGLSGEKIVCLGDSLTFAYEAEFGPPLVSDGFGTKSKNWIEILNGNTSGQGLRSSWFDLGKRKIIDTPLMKVLFRHEYNWSLPGAKVRQLRRFVDGSASFLELMAEDPNFGPLIDLLGLSDSDFALTDLREQITNEASRFVFFVGGNDLRGVYQLLYSGESEGQAWVEAFVQDATEAIERVQSWNPGLPGVIVAVPHVGITPDIRAHYPYDLLATGRVTTVLRELNRRLAVMAHSHGLGFADIFTPTLRMIDPANPLVIHGLTFANAGSTTPHNDFVWLNGKYSANFHPHTNAQAVLANLIIAAFNDLEDNEIPLLSATEILRNLLGKSAAQVDLDFDSWLAAYGLAGRGAHDDSDGDGLPAALEFALGLDPGYADARFVRYRPGPGGMELSYPLRLPGTTKISLTAEAATSPGHFTPLTPQPGWDPATGRARALTPGGAPAAFLRLRATLP